MKLCLFFIGIFLAAVSNAETKSFESAPQKETRAQACAAAKSDAQRWVSMTKQFGYQSGTDHRKSSESYGNCECSSTKGVAGTDRWICTIDATLIEAKDKPRNHVSENRPFDFTYGDETNACLGAKGKAEDYVDGIRGAVLKGVSACQCQSKNNPPAGQWWTCFVNANFTRPE